MSKILKTIVSKINQAQKKTETATGLSVQAHTLLEQAKVLAASPDAQLDVPPVGSKAKKAQKAGDVPPVGGKVGDVPPVGGKKPKKGKAKG